MPFLARSSGHGKGPKMALFWTLRRKVQGEWGGSAHSPDPTAQSAPRSAVRDPARVDVPARGVGGVLWAGQGWGYAKWGVGQGSVPGGVELRSTRTQGPPDIRSSGRSLQINSVGHKSSGQLRRYGIDDAPRSLSKPSLGPTR